MDEQTDKPGLLPRFTLKDGNSFLLADALGDIHSRSDGFFTDDTRILSRFELAIAGRRPSLLGAAINQDNTQFTAHLTNRPLTAPGELAIPQGVIHIERTRFLWANRLFERIRLTNFGADEFAVPLTLLFDADFADIFEVQGRVRAQRGTTLTPQVGASGVCLSYEGRDTRLRSTCVDFSHPPASLSAHEAHLLLDLRKGASTELFVEIGPTCEGVPGAQRFSAASEKLSTSMQHRLHQGARIETSGRLFDQWLARSRSDLAMLTTSLATGPYPYAGIPWFATQFGRDAIITALQTLWINPTLAAGVLSFLASTQAQETSSFRDSQPGKILHETRRGEMAALGEVPFGLYYGGVDTTPLFVMLAGAYEACTGDRTVADAIWNALLAAVAWIERRLDASPTGFLDYARGEASGLVNQAWKDSHDSMFHADGRFPLGPLAVVEVQGYAFAALQAMGELAERRGYRDQSHAWRKRAQRLRMAIEEKFWLADMNFYAIALDGDGGPCRVHASNAGHLLFCGVPSEERAAIVCAELLSSRFCSGWGIRTLAEGQARYNPMSYHNGSIWPHDTSLCAAGIARYGVRGSVAQIMNEIFETAIHFNMRLPELYCGFPRIHGQGPAPYPVACLPQSWACGAAFLLLQASLGIQIDGVRKEVHIRDPVLPQGIETLRVHDLPVRDVTIDLEFRHVEDKVVVAPAKHHVGKVRVLVHL